MERRIGLEGETTGILTLDIDEEFLVLGAEAVQELGMNGDLELVNLLLVALHQGVQCAL